MRSLVLAFMPVLDTPNGAGRYTIIRQFEFKLRPLALPWGPKKAWSIKANLIYMVSYPALFVDWSWQLRSWLLQKQRPQGPPVWLWHLQQPDALSKKANWGEYFDQALLSEDEFQQVSSLWRLHLLTSKFSPLLVICVAFVMPHGSVEGTYLVQGAFSELLASYFIFAWLI